MSAAADEPGRLLLALNGSGQGVYIGLAEDRYLVASEPYGIVEETDRYVRLDGEHGGQIVALDADRAGTMEGIERRRLRRLGAAGVRRRRGTGRGDHDGTSTAATTPHFLLKEISESPDSFAKTLRGKIVDDGGRLRASVGDGRCRAEIEDRLRAAHDHAGAGDRAGHRGGRRAVDGGHPRRARRRARSTWRP